MIVNEILHAIRVENNTGLIHLICPSGRKKFSMSEAKEVNLTWTKQVNTKGAFVRKDSAYRDWVKGMF